MAVSEEAGLGESEPFHLNIEVLNKSEILNKKVGNWWYMGGGMLANSMVSDEKFSATVRYYNSLFFSFFNAIFLFFRFPTNSLK